MPSFSFLDEKSDITDFLLHNPKRYGLLNELAHDLLRGKSELNIDPLAAYISVLAGNRKQ
jgi:hypothetical protein